jgi:uncharacterized membrane protein YeaQ/YmgE (transglycosylase-associated protein family)
MEETIAGCVSENINPQQTLNPELGLGAVLGLIGAFVNGFQFRKL